MVVDDEQSEATVVIYERCEQGFERFVTSDMESTIELRDLQCSLKLADIHNGVEFSNEASDE